MASDFDHPRSSQRYGYTHEPLDQEDAGHARVRPAPAHGDADALGRPGSPSSPNRPGDEWGTHEPAAERPDPSHRFDPDYHEWRAEQMRQLDKEYALWRQERYRKFADEFETWRKQRFAGRTSARMPPPAATHAPQTAPPHQPDPLVQSAKPFQVPPSLGSANALGSAAHDPPPLRSRADRSERPEALDRMDRMDRAERSERLDKAERKDLPERGDRLDRPDRPERPERPGLLSGLLGSHSSRK